MDFGASREASNQANQRTTSSENKSNNNILNRFQNSMQRSHFPRKCKVIIHNPILLEVAAWKLSSNALWNKTFNAFQKHLSLQPLF